MKIFPSEKKVAVIQTKIERYIDISYRRYSEWDGVGHQSSESSSLNYNKGRSVKPAFPFPIHSHFILLGINGP